MIFFRKMQSPKQINKKQENFFLLKILLENVIVCVPGCTYVHTILCIVCGYTYFISKGKGFFLYLEGGR